MNQQGYKPDHVLRAIIREAAANLPPSLNFKPELSTTTINLSKVTPFNVRSQTCIQSLARQALETNLDLKKVKDVCQILQFFWDDLVDDFDYTPETLSGKEKNKLEAFRKILNNSARRVRQNTDHFLYSPRAEAGDQTAADELLVAAVNLLEGLVGPASLLYPRQGICLVPNFSKLEDMVWKCQNMMTKTLHQLNKRLLKTADAEELMLKCIHILKCTGDIVENHPRYKDPNPLAIRPRAVAMPETDCGKMVKAINDAAEDIRENMAVFQDENMRANWRIGSYGTGTGSDELAVKGLADLVEQLNEKFYWECRKLIDNDKVFGVDTVLASVAHYRWHIGNEQLQLFQRLRPTNEPCFTTTLMLPNTDMAAVGRWHIKRSLVFTCRSCEGKIIWDGATERHNIVDPQVPWRSDGPSWPWPVHEHYAVSHHLPAVHRSAKDRNGNAKLYCGYCCKWEIGTPIDPQFVFDDIYDLYKHLHAIHDVEQEDTKCCIIL